MTEPLVRHAAYDFAIPKEMFDDIEKLRADSARFLRLRLSRTPRLYDLLKGARHA